jgi:hypothetical protein
MSNLQRLHNTSMRALAAVLLMLLTVVGACELLDGSGSAGDLLIRTNRSTYAVEDSIEATVANTTHQPFFLENCCGPIILAVERWQEGAWTVYRSNACLLLCLSVPLELPPGERRTAPVFTLDAPGRYRLILHYWDRQRADGIMQRAVSSPFVVE